MLDKDLLSKVEGLSEAQVTQITELSKNDEAVQIELATGKAIADRTRKIYDDLDADIKAVTGLDKPSGMKTYDHLKDNVLVRVGQNADLLKEIDKLKRESGTSGTADEKLTQQLDDKETLIGELRKQIENDKVEFDSKIGENVNELMGLRVTHEFDKGLADMKFDESINDVVVKSFIKSAQSDILSNINPEFVDGKLIFRDSEGKTLLNKENNLNPFTAGELIADKLKPILAKEKSSGAGTKGAVPNKGGKATLDFSGAKSQRQGMEITTKHLLAEGITRGSDKWFDKINEITQSDNYKNLPR